MTGVQLDGRIRLVIICHLNLVIKISSLIHYETINIGNSNLDTCRIKSKLDDNILIMFLTIDDAQPHRYYMLSIPIFLCRCMWCFSNLIA